MLLPFAPKGPVYVPFIGDGDIASEMYSDRKIYGADIDPSRVSTANSRKLKGKIIVADCDNWPFPRVKDKFAIADFDAYSYPYDSFRAFWEHANKAKRMVLFFTDGQRLSIGKHSLYRHPDGTQYDLDNQQERWFLYRTYPIKVFFAWIEEAVKPYKIIIKRFYSFSNNLYFGVTIQK